MSVDTIRTATSRDWNAIERLLTDAALPLDGARDHIREFMDLLGIEKANIAGHSMGGWIATLLAYESPDRINKLAAKIR